MDDDLRAALVATWVDVTNAGGAVGLAAPTTSELVEAVAAPAFASAAAGASHLLVGTIHGTVAGFCFLEHRPGALFRHWALVKRLQVHPRRQGTGCGGALLGEVHRIAKDVLGLEALHLTVRGGTGTEGFYQRLGYDVVATIPQTIRLADDDTRDELYLVKRL